MESLMTAFRRLLIYILLLCGITALFTVLTQLSWLTVVGNPLNDNTFNVVGEMRSNGTKVIVKSRLED